jgi:hypothetical protein
VVILSHAAGLSCDMGISMVEVCIKVEGHADIRSTTESVQSTSGNLSTHRMTVSSCASNYMLTSTRNRFVPTRSNHSSYTISSIMNCITHTAAQVLSIRHLGR